MDIKKLFKKLSPEEKAELLFILYEEFNVPEDMRVQRRLQFLSFDRSDPYQVTCITPAAHPENNTGKAIQKTLLDELKEGRLFMRSDLGMVNVWIGRMCIEQHCVYGTKEGLYGSALDYMTPEQVAEVEAIRLRIIASAEKHPEMLTLLGF